MAEPETMETKEFYSVPLELKEVMDEGEFKGYASVFGNVDHGRDVVEAGAFTKTLKQNKGIVPILANHDSWDQIGWNISAEETSKGLLVHGKLNLEVQSAREKHALAKQAKEVGAQMGLSIGYVPKVREYDDVKKVRRLKEVELWEYSFVTFPMNPKATVTGVKNLLGKDGMDYVQNPRDFENLLCEAGFSNSEAKAIAAFGVKIHKGESQCEADDAEVKELLEMCGQFRSIVS